MVNSLFWSFVASITDTSSAKKGYSLIFAGAQIGTIIGPEFAKHATQIGISTLIFIAACGMFIIPISLMLFINLFPYAPNYTVQKKATGFIEGLRLLLSKPYLIGILGIATFGCIVSTILEFELIFKTKEAYQSTTKIVEFLGLYGQSANFLTLIFSLFFTNIIIRKCGLTLSLVIYPIIAGILVLCVWIFPNLWVLFFAMIIIKSVSYGLNSPCKEITYIPTSNDIKFKTKGWIDTIGYRIAESMGGSVGIIFPIITNLIFFGSVISLCVVGLWITAAIYVGQKNSYLIKNNQIIH